MIRILILWSSFDFLLRLKDETVIAGREDRAFWLESKTSSFFVQSPLLMPLK